MKKLLLLAGIVVNVIAAESTEDRFNEFYDEQARLVNGVLFKDIKYLGYIACDKINQLSPEEYAFIKQRSWENAGDTIDGHHVVVSILLYNNLVSCVEPSKKILSLEYFVDQARNSLNKLQ